jgi:hypothetical protein
MPSSGMLRRLALVRTDVSEERISSIMSVKRTGELGTMLAVISNRIMLRGNTAFCDTWMFVNNPSLLELSYIYSGHEAELIIACEVLTAVYKVHSSTLVTHEATPEDPIRRYTHFMLTLIYHSRTEPRFISSTGLEW